MSPSAKPVTASLKVKVTLLLSPSINCVSTISISTLGASVSVGSSTVGATGSSTCNTGAASNAVVSYPASAIVALPTRSIDMNPPFPLPGPAPPASAGTPAAAASNA